MFTAKGMQADKGGEGGDGRQGWPAEGLKKKRC